MDCAKICLCMRYTRGCARRCGRTPQGTEEAKQDLEQKGARTAYQVMRQQDWGLWSLEKPHPRLNK